MAKVEILQTQAEVANREVALEEAENQIDAARLALVALLALEPRTPLYATAPTSVDWRPTDPTRALETALTLQPDYLSMKILVERAKISLDYAKNQQLWDLSLVATRTQARSGGASPGAMDIQASGARTGGSYAGLQLTIPFGDRSIKQPEVRASVDLHTQELKLLETRQTVEHRIRDATRNVQTRWRQLELSIKARDLSRQKLEAEKEKLQVGQSSNFQVLSFENDLRNAENARLNAQITYLNTLTELDERMGKTLDVWSIPIIQTNGYEN
jgi:outer membrane protein TolC